MDNETMTLMIGGLLGFIAIGRLVAKFTKTPKDDAFFSRAGESVKGFFKKAQ